MPPSKLIVTIFVPPKGVSLIRGGVLLKEGGEIIYNLHLFVCMHACMHVCL